MNKKKIIIISVIAIVLLIGVSFAYWMVRLTQESTNNIATSCFNLSLSENNAINLQSAYPIKDSEGEQLTPYEFTITNNCSTYAYYEVNLEILNTTDLESQFVKVMLDDENSSLLSNKTVTTTTLSNASSSYRLKTAYLHASESKTYHLRLWLDESATLTDNVTEKEFTSKITIRATYKPDVPTQMEECEAEYGEGASICNFIAQADPDNDNCLKVDENGMIIDPYSTMSDEEEPIICTMEDDYGTSYYLRGNHQDNNVKFANMCWKLVRVTGTGGYKLIYNGDLDENGKCTTTSGEHLGFTGQTLSLSGNMLYGTSYTYDGTNYTLTDTSNIDFSTDSISTIGKYTCGDTNTSCTTLYVVTGEYSSTQGYALKLDQSTNYAQIGTTAFNDYNSPNFTEFASPALVGYMYNDTYPNKSQNLSSNTNNYYYGESFTYTGGTYTLNNTVQFADVSDSTNKTSLNTHHYTCFNATGNTCTEMYYINYLSGKTLYYIKLNGNETGPEALNKMLSNDLPNAKNSYIKEAIDWWYEQHLKNTEYESKLEDTVFCNDRTIDDIGGWSETGTLGSLKFNACNGKYYLKCPNKRDAFTVSDTEKGNSALTYPVGLLTKTEHSLIGNYTANKTGSSYWTSTPTYFYSYLARVGDVDSTGYWNVSSYVSNTHGARPAVSLRPGTNFKAGGDGSASNPYEVDMS